MMPYAIVYLEWPEKCFRADARALRHLRARLPKGSRVVWAKDEETFLRHLPKATHAFVWYFKAAWFPQAPKLRLLATPAAGRELLPTACPKGVTMHFGHYHGPIMAESVAAFVMAWARGFLLKPQETTWPRVWMSDKIYAVRGTRAVIIGYGHVGQAIGEKLASLGIEVFGYSRHLGIAAAELTGKLRHADWLVLALPGEAETDRYLNARLIAKLPRRCVVINVGRGNAVDEPALFSALASKRLAGAYLDVRPVEPYRRFGLPGGTKGVPPAPKLDNLVLMPHASAFAPDYMERFIEELKDDGVL